MAIAWYTTLLRSGKTLQRSSIIVIQLRSRIDTEAIVAAIGSSYAKAGANPLDSALVFRPILLRALSQRSTCSQRPLDHVETNYAPENFNHIHRIR